MFEFLTRRHAAPAETPLSEVRFTREDLFVLLGGCDTGMFANGEYTIDFDQIERHGTDPWRRDMAARLSPTGLVDAEGIPSDELAEALYPLNKPGISVNDAPMPQAPGDRDRRTVSMVVFDGHASAIKSVGTRRGGFNMVPLPAGEGLDAAFRSLVLAPKLCHAERRQRLFFESNPEVGRRITSGDVAWARDRCADRGEDPRQLCTFVGRLAADSSLWGSGRRFISSDYRGCRFEESLGFSIPQTNSGDFRKKNSLIFLREGAAFVDAAACVGTERSIAEFAAVEFISQGTLLDYLFDFYPYPDSLPSS